MLTYATAHWRGQLSLALSFWVNLALPWIALLFVLYFLYLFVMSQAGLGFPDEHTAQPLEIAARIAFGVIGFGWLVPLPIWASVGVFRSALKAMKEKGSTMAPALAIGFTALYALAMSALAIDLIVITRG